MVSCEYFKDKISEYIEGTLPKEDKNSVEQHSKNCSDCNSLLHRLRDLNTSLHNLEPVKTSDLFQAVLRSKLRKEIEYESETVFDKIVVFFQVYKMPAFGFSLAALLFITYISYDLYRHYENENTSTLTSSVLPTPTQELPTTVPDLKPFVREQDKSKEYFILEEVSEKDILKEEGWSHIDNIRLLDQSNILHSGVTRRGVAQANLQMVSF